MLESILILQFGLLKCSRLKRRYSILFGFINDLFETKQENVSLRYNSINKKLKSVREKKINIYECHQNRSGCECQDISI